MKINAFAVNPFGEMVYLLWDPASRQGAIVDPGMSSDEEFNAVDDFIASNKIELKYLINTHLHLDHVFGNKHIEEKYGLKTSANENDNFLGRNVANQARQFHLRINAQNVEVDNPLHDGDILPLGNEELIVIETPGHSPGSISIYCPQSHFLLSGDTLFKGSVGRTDLEGGNHGTLSNSIRQKLFTLPDDTLVLPGHGPATTIGEERRNNPYV